VLVFLKLLIPYLRKESQPGDLVNLYALFGVCDIKKICDIKNRKRTLLVEEFDADTEGTRKGYLS
jgi:hypothetical protein